MTPCSNTTLVSDPDCLSSPTEPLSSTRTGLFVFTQPALICSVLMEQASVMGMRNVPEASVFEHLVLVVLFGGGYGTFQRCGLVAGGSSPGVGFEGL